MSGISEIQINSSSPHPPTHTDKFFSLSFSFQLFHSVASFSGSVCCAGSSTKVGR